MATVGQVLNAPEAGWRRINDNHYDFTYTGMLANTSMSGSEGSDVHYTTTVGQKVEFSFKGTKLRILVNAYASTTNLSVKIDGVTENISYISGVAGTVPKILAYEKNGLSDAPHTVTITYTGGFEFDFDCIDIDSTGYMVQWKTTYGVLRRNVAGIGNGASYGWATSTYPTGIWNASNIFNLNDDPTALGKIDNTLYGWASQSTTPAGPLYITAELSELVDIGQVVLFNSMNDGDTKQFKISISTDSASKTNPTHASWVEIYSGTLPDNGIDYPVDISATATAKYIRFTWINAYYTGGNYAELYGLKVYPKVFPPLQFLIEEGGVKKYHNGTSWQTISGSVNKAMFDTYGMTNTTLLLSNLSGLGKFKLLTYRGTNIPSPQSYTAIPKGQVILQNDDFALKEVSAVNDITVTGNGSNLRLIISKDKGVTWKTFVGGTWVDIDPTLLSVVKTDGMTAATFNGLTKTEWDSLFSSSYNTIRFGYYLEKTDILDTCEVDNLVVNLDLKGYWKRAAHGVDYDYRYTTNTTATVEILQDGSYKINSINLSDAPSGGADLDPATLEKINNLDRFAQTSQYVFQEEFKSNLYIDNAKTTAVWENEAIRIRNKKGFIETFDDLTRVDTGNSTQYDISNGTYKIASSKFTSTLVSQAITITPAKRVGVSPIGLTHVQGMNIGATTPATGDKTYAKGSAHVVYDKAGRRWEFQLTNQAAVGNSGLYYTVTNADGSQAIAPTFITDSASTNNYGLSEMTSGVDNSNRVWLAYRGITSSGYGNLTIIAFNPDGSTYYNQRGIGGSSTTSASQIRLLVTPNNRVFVNYLYDESSAGQFHYLLVIDADTKGTLVPAQIIMQSPSSGYASGANLLFNSANNMVYVVASKTSTTMMYYGMDIDLLTAKTVENSAMTLSGMVLGMLTSFIANNKLYLMNTASVSADAPIVVKNFNFAADGTVNIAVNMNKTLTQNTYSNGGVTISPFHVSGRNIRLINDGTKLHMISYRQPTANVNRIDYAQYDYDFNLLTPIQIIDNGETLSKTNMQLNKRPDNGVDVSYIVNGAAKFVSIKPALTTAAFEISVDGGVNYSPNIATSVTDVTSVKVRIKLDAPSMLQAITPTLDGYMITLYDDITGTLTEEFVTITLPSAKPASRAMLTATQAANGGTITWYISSDSGATWTQIQLGQLLNFTSSITSDIRLKAVLTNPTGEANAPVIYDYNLATSGTALVTDLQDLQTQLLQTNLKLASLTSATRYGLKNLAVDDFKDTSGVDMVRTTATIAGGLVGPQNGTRIPTESNGATIVSSIGEYNTTYAVTKLLNRTTGTAYDNGWLQSTGATTHPSTGAGALLTVTLPTATSISRIRLLMNDNYGGDHAYCHHQIEVYNPATSSWNVVVPRVNIVNAYDMGPAGTGWWDYSFPSITTTQYRIRVWHFGSPVFLCMNEIEVYQTGIDGILYTKPEVLAVQPIQVILTSNEVGPTPLLYEVTRDGVNYKTISPTAPTDLTSLPPGTLLSFKVTILTASQTTLSGLAYAWK